MHHRKQAHRSMKLIRTIGVFGHLAYISSGFLTLLTKKSVRVHL
ncbi:hypothetical protein BVI2075_780030 [Burkholderia vietnamiensis]|nr:hypothetical protein BVI2075_780030 [Burkholderia vietnamiensis]